MYFWQKTGFKICLGVAIVAAVVLVTLFSDQIGNLLSLFGSKAGVARSVVWGNSDNPWNQSGHSLLPQACIIDLNIDGGKLTLCPPDIEDPDPEPDDPIVTDTDGDGTSDGVDTNPLDPAIGGTTNPPDPNIGDTTGDTTTGDTTTGGTTTGDTTTGDTTTGDTTTGDTTTVGPIVIDTNPALTP